MRLTLCEPHGSYNNNINRNFHIVIISRFGGGGGPRMRKAVVLPLSSYWTRKTAVRERFPLNGEIYCSNRLCTGSSHDDENAFIISREAVNRGRSNGKKIKRKDIIRDVRPARWIWCLVFFFFAPNRICVVHGVMRSRNASCLVRRFHSRIYEEITSQSRLLNSNSRY